MLQISRRLRDGQVELVEVPEPLPAPGMVGVRVEASVISAGTERATLEVAGKNLLAKARARPDQARQVLERTRTQGVRSTIALVRQRLEELGPLGYSAAGRVVQAGPETRGLRPGDRVAVGGAGFASHAEVDVVPSLLCARVPDGVSSADAAFATVGAIAINGFRRAEANVGSTIAVVGLGLIGQLAVRVARAAGCRVLGIDLDPAQAELAARAGAEAVPRAELENDPRWEETADAVLICAATKSRDPVELAAALARDRATVVVVGDVELVVPRAPFYEKELDLRLARSYGPGRYDPDYELHGLDYPIGQVRWSEQRNMQAFLELVADGKLDPSELVSHRFAFEDAERAFELLQGEERVTGILLEYEQPGAEGAAAHADPKDRPRVSAARPRRPSGGRRFALIGPGSFATGTLIPGLVRAGLEPAGVASASGLSAEGARRRFGFETAHSDPAELLATSPDLVVIATRHDSHASLVVMALEAGLPTYVEKPLALTDAELADVARAQAASGVPLFVGFNRRYAPSAMELRRLPGPRLMTYRINAGRVAADNWVNDPTDGGGRLRGEGCHFIDFLCDQAVSDLVSVSAKGFPSSPSLPLVATDNFNVRLEFADGSVGVVTYAADAPTGPGKERFETSAPGAFGYIDDFRRAAIWRGTQRTRLGGRRQDKGFAAQFDTIAKVLRGEAEPPPFDGFLVSTLATLSAARSLGSGHPEPVLADRSEARVGEAEAEAVRP